MLRVLLRINTDTHLPQIYNAQRNTCGCVSRNQVNFNVFNGVHSDTLSELQKI